MTTTAPRVQATAGAPLRAGGLAGTARLTRFNLRRDRVRIPIWMAAIALVLVTAPGTYSGLYPTQADRDGQAAIVFDNPAMKAMTGPGHGIDDYTYGAMIANEYLGFMAIFVALMSVLLVVRHTRAEEESGRAELIRANVVGRNAQLAAALVTAAVVNVALGALIAVGMAAQGVASIDWPGSLAFGTALAAVGLVFAGVAAVTAQITEYSRAASGMAGALIGVAYAVRAIGDVADNWLSWLSPIGWAQAAAPYVDNIWWPLLLSAVVTSALAAAAFAVSARRDVGAGLRAQRLGARTASPRLGTPMGFAWRLQRSGVLWWAVGLLFFGLAYGSAVDIIEDYADNQIIQDLVNTIGGASLTESWLSMIISLLAIVCTVFAIIAALRPRREETSGRAEPVLATALSRTQWVATHVGIALLGGTAMLLVTGIGLGGAAASLTGDAGLFWEILGALLAYAPALWVTVGLAVTVFGLAPRVTRLTWGLVVYAALIVYLGGLLELPQWMHDLSPFTHVPRMPAAEFTLAPLLGLTALAAGLVALGLYGFRRRDLQTN